MSDDTFQDQDVPKSDDGPLARCPACGDPVIAITTRGPTVHAAHPCGCFLPTGRLGGNR